MVRALSRKSNMAVCTVLDYGSEARECCDGKIKKRVSNCPPVYRSKSKDNPRLYQCKYRSKNI